MDLSVTLRGRRHELRLKNPVMTASGTFGYGTEFAPYGDLSRLGGMVVKGLSLQPRDGNPCPRIVETTAGMLNAVGLQNDGVDSFLRDKLPRLPWEQTPVVANLYATSAAEFAELAARLDEAEGVAALEVNISCPNVKQGGILFGQDPDLAAAVTRAVRDKAPHKPVIVKLSPKVPMPPLLGFLGERRIEVLLPTIRRRFICQPISKRLHHPILRPLLSDRLLHTILDIKAPHIIPKTICSQHKNVASLQVDLIISPVLRLNAPA